MLQSVISLQNFIVLCALVNGYVSTVFSTILFFNFDNILLIRFITCLIVYFGHCSCTAMSCLLIKINQRNVLGMSGVYKLQQMVDTGDTEKIS